MQAAVGRRGRFRLMAKLPRRIQPGAGAEAESNMMPLESWSTFPFLSCPRSHLTDIEALPSQAALERRRTGRP